jgi:hypothetical protein
MQFPSLPGQIWNKWTGSSELDPSILPEQAVVSVDFSADIPKRDAVVDAFKVRVSMFQQIPLTLSHERFFSVSTHGMHMVCLWHCALLLLYSNFSTVFQSATLSARTNITRYRARAQT